jgi:hypothetical protein
MQWTGTTKENLLTVEHSDGHGGLSLIFISHKSPSTICANLVLHIEELLHLALFLALFLECLFVHMVGDAPKENLVIRHCAVGYCTSTTPLCLPDSRA